MDSLSYLTILIFFFNRTRVRSILQFLVSSIIFILIQILAIGVFFQYHWVQIFQTLNITSGRTGRGGEMHLCVSSYVLLCHVMSYCQKCAVFCQTEALSACSSTLWVSQEFLDEASSESLTSVLLLGIGAYLPSHISVMFFGNFLQTYIKILLA